MNPAKAERLKKILQKTLDEYVESGEVQADALAPALRYNDWHDKEFTAFICSVIAYGRVEHIKKSIFKILDPMGPRPHQWLMSASDLQINRLTENWAHRFNTAHDMQILLKAMRSIYKEFGSLEAFSLKSQPKTAFELIEGFVLGVEEKVKRAKPSNSFWFFLPRPSAGSACKRQNLFLRWMIGRGPLDLRLWNQFSTKILIIPLDVHVLRQAQSLKLTKRKQADWVTAEEVTAALRHLDQDDPVQFDFALCHLGMNGKILRGL